MKVKITEEQHKLIQELQKRKRVREQEFLAQQTRVNIG
jgi:hypothetical protein